jgi:hypothetical protein
MSFSVDLSPTDLSEGTVQRRLASLGIFIAVLASFCFPWNSAAAVVHHNSTSWSQRDRAVYVVSTMNVLHCRSGRLLTDMLVRKFGVTHYDVYADQQSSELYFIEPKRDDGTSAGSLAYQMGWAAPMSVSTFLDKLHIHHAPGSAVSAYRNDLKQLIGSFTSTIPS